MVGRESSACDCRLLSHGFFSVDFFIIESLLPLFASIFVYSRLVLYLSHVFLREILAGFWRYDFLLLMPSSLEMECFFYFCDM